MKITVIPIIVGVLRTILKNQVKKMGELEKLEVLKLSRPLHCWNQQKYGEESRRVEDICYYLYSNENHQFVQV